MTLHSSHLLIMDCIILLLKQNNANQFCEPRPCIDNPCPLLTEKPATPGEIGGMHCPEPGIVSSCHCVLKLAASFTEINLFSTNHLVANLSPLLCPSGEIFINPHGNTLTEEPILVKDRPILVKTQNTF